MCCSFFFYLDINNSDNNNNNDIIFQKNINTTLDTLESIFLSISQIEHKIARDMENVKKLTNGCSTQAQ